MASPDAQRGAARVTGPKIMVTGATGKLGSSVVRHLLALTGSERVAVLARKAQKATALRDAGVEVREGNYEDADGLVEAFTGIDRLLIISSGGPDLLQQYAESPAAAEETRLRQHTNAIKAAREAGVAFVAYTSAPKASTSQMAIAPIHAASEALLRELGTPYCILRNNWYIENAFDEIAVIPAALQGSPIYTAAGDGKIGWVLRDELGEAAARVLLEAERHQNRTYELAGMPATYDDLAHAVSEASGRSIVVRHVDSNTYYRAVDSLVQVPMTTTEAETAFQDEVRLGYLEVESSDLAELLGRPPLTLTETVRAALDDRPVRH